MRGSDWTHVELHEHNQNVLHHDEGASLGSNGLTVSHWFQTARWNSAGHQRDTSSLNSTQILISEDVLFKDESAWKKKYI